MRITQAFLKKLRDNPSETLSNLSDDDLAYVFSKAMKAYHSKQPIMTDSMFDLVQDALEARNKSHSALSVVGAPVTTATKKVRLPFFMGSMDKNKGNEKSLESFKSKCPGSYVISDKLDGISALFHVVNGKASFYTRGDGTFGQDITHLLKHIQGVPHTAISNKTFTVRGELLITKEDFAKVKDRGVNARNMVSGLVNAKKPDMTLLPLVRFVAYSMLVPEHTVEDQMKTVASLGFDTVYWSLLSDPNSLNFEKLSEILLERRRNSAFEIDGIIVAHNAYHKPKTSGNPDHAFAFKSVLTQESAEVTVTQVEWNPSKDGYLVPVVVFNPVYVSGVTIQRATGFNGEFIATNKIGPGARLIVTRSGEVIPYIMTVLEPAASGSAQMPAFPYEWSTSGKDIITTGENVEINKRIIENFFSKADIPGIRAGTISKLYDAGLNTIKKILTAKPSDFMKADGIQAKTAAKLTEAIRDKLTSLECVTLMDASNAFGRGFGSKRLTTIIEAYPRIVSDTKFTPTKADLVAVNGVSDTIAEAFLDGLKKYRAFVDDLGISCLNAAADSARQPATKAVGTKLKDAVVVFTGFRDEALKKAIEEQGGKVVDSVSKKTTILVTKNGEASSAKAEKARLLGAKIVTLSEMQKAL